MCEGLRDETEEFTERDDRWEWHEEQKKWLNRMCGTLQSNRVLEQMKEVKNEGTEQGDGKKGMGVDGKKRRKKTNENEAE